MTEPLKIVIVDDNRTNLSLMDMLVRKLPGFTTELHTNPVSVFEMLPTITFDIAIVDYQMPDMNGIELTRTIRSHARLADKPIVMVTVDHDADIKMAALEAGAVEFLHKPIEPVEFKTRIRNLGRLCEVQRKLHSHSGLLQGEVEKATAALRWREEEIINRLARAAGYKDRETARHTVRMARLCAILASQLGLPPEDCRDIQLAAPMHDIGKVGVRDNVLLKRGMLTEEERQHMNGHTVIGAAILADSPCSLLKLAADIARTHHERWDGAGYPAGLRGEQIPLAGRIAAVADVFDALTSTRPYKPAWSVEKAFAHLREQAGQQFDPACVDAFVRGRQEIEQVLHAMQDEVEAAA